MNRLKKPVSSKPYADELYALGCQVRFLLEERKELYG